jgi:hypothetical protein
MRLWTVSKTSRRLDGGDGPELENLTYGSYLSAGSGDTNLLRSATSMVRLSNWRLR